MDKRRKRVQEWLLQRKKQESNHGHEPMCRNNNWTSLEGELSSSYAVVDDTVVDNNAMVVDTEIIDPLDAYMNYIVLPQLDDQNKVINNGEEESSSTNKTDSKDGSSSHDGELHGARRKRKARNKSIGRIIQGEDSDSDYGDYPDSDGVVREDEDDDEFIERATKKIKLEKVDHDKIQFTPPFRKKLYIEVKEISRMTTEEVATYRKQHELKVYGKDVPKPIKTWVQAGLSTKVLDAIKKYGFEKPMPVQAQALPVLMSGRDCIGVAKTGSGKTLAFVLPMLRHIKDQPPTVPGDGPIGLIIAPTRELVQQIHNNIQKFAKAIGVKSVAVYGGGDSRQQIRELKRGPEIVVCTPGRMIDVLDDNSEKIINLRRVTYLVMDEADRMFDTGFEPQITSIVAKTRSDRQTVLFSATLPHKIEEKAKKVLNNPVKIQVGGRSVVNKDITQRVEMRPENGRFARLLELLGERDENRKTLIFVNSQEKCDSLFKDLYQHGYKLCRSLHGGNEQTDRESTISDFKSNVSHVLIATSCASRGLDVKDLELVINYDVPNHYEDYVHRVGRTGRVGRKGTAITFISENDARFAPDLVKALKLSGQAVPGDLKALADAFMAKVNQGLEQAHSTGYGGSGFKFDEKEDEARKAAKKAQAREYGFEEEESDSDSEDEGIRKAGGDLSQQASLAQAAAITAASMVPTPVSTAQLLPNGGIPTDGAARAAALAAAMNLQHNLAKIQADVMPQHYQAELEINDFPQNARFKVMHKDTLGMISESTGAAITTRGQFYPTGKIPGPGERKLYLFIEGPTESSVKKAKADVKRVLEERQFLSLPRASQQGKYSVL